ncbi:MAG: DUF2798 domain-containing protein [Rubrobacteraceae bacterium]
MKVSQKVFGISMSVAIGFVMSFALSLLLLLVSVGPVEGFLFIWMKSFATAFVISVPVGIVAIPLTERFLRIFLRVQE